MTVRQQSLSATIFDVSKTVVIAMYVCTCVYTMLKQAVPKKCSYIHEIITLSRDLLDFCLQAFLFSGTSCIVLYFFYIFPKVITIF